MFYQKFLTTFLNNIYKYISTMNAEIVMENEIIKGPLTVRITFLGNTAVGKTAIINRIISNTFTAQYEPTMKIDNYGINLNISENNVTKKTYVMINLEDT
jgi:GTPase SAR1 family protein